MIVMGIDPGPKDNAAVVIGSNGKVFDRGNEWATDDLIVMSMQVDLVAIEDFIIYQPLSSDGRETIKAIGALRHVLSSYSKVVEIPRRDVLIELCGKTKGGDTALRAAITDLYGGDRRAAWGTKKSPGPLYGLTGSHMLAALGVAITAQRKEKP